LFSPENRDATVLALVESQGGTASAANEGARTRPSGRLDVAEVYAMVDALGDVAQAIKAVRPNSLTKLYKELGIKVSYRHEESGGETVISLVVANVRARGDLYVSHTATARRFLAEGEPVDAVGEQPEDQVSAATTPAAVALTVAPIARVGTLRKKAAGSSVLVSWLAPTLSLRCSFEVLSAPRTPAHRECCRGRSAL
jgi:hypothetical protein